jgi:hypothetical protein
MLRFLESVVLSQGLAKSVSINFRVLAFLTIILGYSFSFVSHDFGPRLPEISIRADMLAYG